MVDYQWFVIRSSHAVRLIASIDHAPKALCGKWGQSNQRILDVMPSGKSCESCLRIVAKASSE